VELTNEYCLRYIASLKDEAEQAKKNRMDLNRDNYAMYQLEHNFGHKMKGQSKETLSKVRNATESSKAFFQQALADLDDWFRITAADESGGDGMLVRPEEMQKLLDYMLKKADYFSHVGASAQSGLLGSVAVSKVRGAMVPKPKYKTKKEGKGTRYKKYVTVTEDKTWELKFDNIRQEDYYPDPTGNGLYIIEDCLLDLYVVRALSEGDNAIYDKSAVDTLKPWGDADLQQEKKARETGQNSTSGAMRPRVRITEFWGNVVDDQTGEMLAENVVITIANDTTVIRKPTPNPLWHQRSPIISAAMIEVANSVWGIAMMDAGTKHNRALIELFNLMLDAAMKSVWGVNQLRTDVLDDPSQITDGIPWGTNLKVGSGLPVGGKVMEPVLTGTIPPEVLNMFNLLNQETLTSMKTNDLRMGAQSMRAVKATEVVASENSITSEFQGIAKNFEEKKIQPELELACYTICQNWDLIDSEIFVSLFGRERGEVLAQIEPQDIFVQVVNGFKFEVFGISLTLRRQADFRKWTTLLQTIGSSEVLIESFLQKYSFEKLLGEIMSAIDLNKTKIEQDVARPQLSEQPSAESEQQAMAQPGGAPGATPQSMTQIPDASVMTGMQGGLAAAFSGAGNNMNMPSSQALR
jgi:hypothetical protein